MKSATIKKDIKQIIDMTEEVGTYDCETEILDELRAKLLGYKAIDLGFLGKIIEVESDEICAPLPNFAIHKINKTPNIEEVRIEFRIHGGCVKWIREMSSENSAITIPYQKNVDKWLEEHPVSGDESSLVHYKHTFKGLIPAEVKRSISTWQDDDMLKQYSIFLCAEVSSIDWVESRRATDPLIIGIIGESAWLVAKFDCTPVEEYISKEFIL